MVFKETDKYLVNHRSANRANLVVPFSHKAD